MKYVDQFMKQMKNLMMLIASVFYALAPLSVFLVGLVGGAYFLQLDYLKLLEILIWPITLLIALFFFKKVFTYLFFSMDSFSFFGAKGHLKNVKDVIDEEVLRLFEREKQEKERKSEISVLREDLDKKSVEVDGKSKESNNNLVVAQRLMKMLTESDRRGDELEAQNAKLSRLIRNQQMHGLASDGVDILDDNLGGILTDESRTDEGKM